MSCSWLLLSWALFKYKFESRSVPKFYAYLQLYSVYHGTGSSFWSVKISWPQTTQFYFATCNAVVRIMPAFSSSTCVTTLLREKLDQNLPTVRTPLADNLESNPGRKLVHETNRIPLKRIYIVHYPKQNTNAHKRRSTTNRGISFPHQH